MENTYLIGVISAAVVGAVAELIPPDGDGGISGAFKLFISLLVLCVIAMPVLDATAAGEADWEKKIDQFLGELETAESESDVYVERTAAMIREAGEEAAEGELVFLLAERFGVPSDSVRAEITLGEDTSGIVPLEIKVFLRGRAIFADPYAIEEYLGALFGGISTVIIE